MEDIFPNALQLPISVLAEGGLRDMQIHAGVKFIIIVITKYL